MSEIKQTSAPHPIARPIAPGGDPFGTHRALEPKGSLPQPAKRVDNDFTRLFEGELLLQVETLNVDAASFRQMEEAVGAEASSGDAGRAVARAVEETVRARGKQHNPVTGSGGMLLVRVLQVAPGRSDSLAALQVGDRIASLVLSLTPLRIDAIRAVRQARARRSTSTAKCSLCEAMLPAKLPSDLLDRPARQLDVAGPRRKSRAS